MNADVSLKDNAVPAMVEFMRASERLIGVSPVIYDQGIPRHAAGRAMTPLLTVARDTFFGKPLRWTRWYIKAMMSEHWPGETFFAEKITNGCCLLRREAFLSIGGFAESQLLYWTEEEFGRRAARLGYVQAAFGKATVDHDHGSSTVTLPRSFLRAIVVHDRISYIYRSFGPSQALMVELLMIFRPKIHKALDDLRSYQKWRPKIKAIKAGFSANLEQIGKETHQRHQEKIL